MCPEGNYACIVADPPWPQGMVGHFASRAGRPDSLRYSTMTLAEIMGLPIGRLARPATHLWLWTTNRFLRSAFDVMGAWGFKYLTTITWVKPSGLGAWFANTTQHCLFGYYQRCEFKQGRYLPTHFHATVRPGQHSRKPDEFYQLVRKVSPEPRIDLFNRRSISGFEGWGDEAKREIGASCRGAES